MELFRIQVMKHLDQKKYIWILIVISAGFYLFNLRLFPVPDETLLNYLKPITTVVSFDTFVVILFNKWIWKWKLLYNWLVPFPNLNGTWKGHIFSNWIDVKTGSKPAPIPVILTIKQTFINISCVMRTVEMNSYSFISGFDIDKENQILRLIYLYHSIPKQTVIDRSPSHYGTIIFDIINDNGSMELNGDYFNERKVTGRIELVFWKKELLEKYPVELGEHPVTKSHDE